MYKSVGNQIDPTDWSRIAIGNISLKEVHYFSRWGRFLMLATYKGINGKRGPWEQSLVFLQANSSTPFFLIA